MRQPCLAVLLLLAAAVALATPAAGWSLFGKAEEVDPAAFTSLQSYGPYTAKTMLALRGAVLAKTPQPAVTAAVAAVNATGVVPMQRVATVPYGANSSVTLQRDSNNSLSIYFFNDNDLTPAAADAPTSPVPFLSQFMSAAQAPTSLVTQFAALTATPALASTTQELMGGEEVLWVTCSGEGAAGGLAILCGAQAALQYPRAGVAVITFGTPWAGYNPQFAWAFDRLVQLYYLWPFSPSAEVAPALPPVNVNNATSVASAASQLAQGLDSLIRQKGTLAAAVTLPNLPPALPKGSEELKKDNVVVPPGDYDSDVEQCYASFNTTSLYGGNSQVCYTYSPKIKSLGTLAPAQPGMPPSACPVIICKTRDYLDMSSVGFKVNATGAAPAVFNGLPYRVLHDNKTNADAIVLWNDTKKEAILLWKYTEEARDWLTDATAYKTDNFVGDLAKLFPAAVGLTDSIKDPQVHAGFYNQFASLAITGVGANNLTQQLLELSSGQQPLFVAISGFSLGGGLSEIAGVWAAYMWPLAHLTVATQGAPKVGNADFVTLFKATVGQVYRFQFNLDTVPYTPPLSGYRTTPNPIWITSEGGGPYYTILTARPDSKDATWYDHWSEVFYVPNLFSEGAPARIPPSPSSLAVSAPQFVYTAAAATP